MFVEGDSCEASKEMLRHKTKEAGKPVNTVSFNSMKSTTVKSLKEIAQQTGGRYLYTVFVGNGGHDVKITKQRNIIYASCYVYLMCSFRTFLRV